MTAIMVRSGPDTNEQTNRLLHVEAEFWDQPELGQPLAARDIAAIYRKLQAAGMTQRRIAALTGQQQSEVSEILAGRHVRMIEVLERIADGLRIPRHRMGLGPAVPESQIAVGLSVLPKAVLSRGLRRPMAKMVFRWTGSEIRMLREALRMSVREFGAHLGVSDRMVSKWEAGGSRIVPRPINQAALDTCLARASPEVQARFAAWPTRTHDHASLLEADRWVVHVAADVPDLAAAIHLADELVASAGQQTAIAVHDTTVSPESHEWHRFRVFCDRVLPSQRRCRRRHGHLDECHAGEPS